VFSEEKSSEEEFEKARANLEEYMSQLDGDWEGKISSFELQGNLKDKPYSEDLILRIDGDSVFVGFKKGDKWFMSGYDFKIIRFKTHAIIYAFASGDAWVEAFNFTVTLGDINEMNLIWNRAVSNYMVAPSEPLGRGYFHGFAKLKRKDA